MAKAERKKSLEITKAQLLGKNPRYTDFNEIDWNRIREEGNKKTNDEIALDLLSYEEDFTSFKTLLKSLSIGYDENQDQIICVETKAGDFVVVEGNRRLLALKMLIDIEWGINVIEDFIEKINNQGDLVTFSSENDWEPEPIKDSKIKKANSVIKLLKKLDEDGIKIERNLKVDTLAYFYKDKLDVVSLRNAIFGRSVSAPGGKLKWPRFQTLSNTWNAFIEFYKETKGDYTSSCEKTADFLGRSLTAVKKEIENAKLIMAIKESYGVNSTVPDWKKVRTSAMELALDEIDITSITGVKTLREFFEVKINPTHPEEEIEHNDSIDFKTLATFIVDNFFNNNYTTRGWKTNKSKRPLFELLGIEFVGQTFYELLDSKETSEIVENIKRLTLNMKTLVDKFEEEELVSDNNEDSSFNILRNFVKRILRQEFLKLTADFGTQTVYSYPYFSLATFARTCAELSVVYAFGKSEFIRSQIIQKEKLLGPGKLYKLFDQKSSKEVFELIYTDKNPKFKYATRGIFTFVNYRMKSNKYLEFMDLIRRDNVFSRFESNYENILRAYESTNYNRTTHAPYWLNTNKHIITINDVMLNSLVIIYNLSLILGIGNISSLVDLLNGI